MNRSEFDKFAQEYTSVHAGNIAASGEEPAYFAEYKVRDLKALVESAGLPEVRRILDFGAGIGSSASHFRRHFPDSSLACIDVSLQSLAIGAHAHGEVGFAAFDGKRLPFADGTFDCVFSACEFHHIDAAEHVGLLAELRRVLRPGGLVQPQQPQYNKDLQELLNGHQRSGTTQAGTVNTAPQQFRDFRSEMRSVLQNVPDNASGMELAKALGLNFGS